MSRLFVGTFLDRLSTAASFPLEEHGLLIYLAAVVVLGIAAQWLAWRFRLPSILLLLAFGVTLGQFLNPDELLGEMAGADASAAPRILLPIVSLAVGVILLEGGLTLRLSELKTSGGVVLRLVTIGALVSGLLTTLAARFLLGLEWQLASLLGAVLVVTGPTVVMPLLRHIRPVRRVGAIVKWEGIVIDPIGAVLAVLVFEQVLAKEGSPIGIAWIILQTVAIGAVLGWGAGMLLAQVLKRYWVPDFLHGVVVLATAVGAFVLSNVVRPESGLVTVTVLGVTLANQKSVTIRHIAEFKEHLVVLLVSCLFILLGSRLELQVLREVTVGDALFLIAMIFVVRPASVFLSTLGSEIHYRERLFLAFLAPRGIVAAAVMSVFALKVATLAGENESLAGLAAQADRLVPVTFLVIVSTVAFYGLLAAPLARWLRLADPNPQGVLIAGADSWIRTIAAALKQEGFAVMLVDTNFRNVADARMAGLAADCASILSEHVREETDLGGIGRLLAMTPNDEVNALAAREFVHQFGRANVYQLAPWESGEGRRQSLSPHMRGRQLFGEKLNYHELARCMRQGFQIKRTRLTEEFEYDDFVAEHGSEAVPLFLIGETKTLTVCTADGKQPPRAGQTVIALIPPRGDDDESAHPDEVSD
jgi:CPA1 family monovalent cation:H+ antiporter